MITINAIGDSCPIPVVKTLNAIKELKGPDVVETLVDNIVGYIGMYTAYLGGLDALVFTGGIGLHSDRIRTMVCSRLAYLNLELDAEKNTAANTDLVSTAGSSVAVYRIKTDEEIVVARNVYGML